MPPLVVNLTICLLSFPQVSADCPAAAQPAANPRGSEVVFDPKVSAAFTGRVYVTPSPGQKAAWLLAGSIPILLRATSVLEPGTRRSYSIGPSPSRPLNKNRPGDYYARRSWISNATTASATRLLRGIPTVVASESISSREGGTIKLAITELFRSDPFRERARQAGGLESPLLSKFHGQLILHRAQSSCRAPMRHHSPLAGHLLDSRFQRQLAAARLQSK